MAWLLEGRSQEAVAAAGWAGVQSLPRILSLHADGRLAQTPAPELRSLRGAHWRREGVETAGPDWSVRPELTGAQLEMRVRIIPRLGQSVGLRLRRSPDGQEETVVSYDRWLGLLTIDRHRSSLDPTTLRVPRVLPLKLAPGEPLDLHLFLDRSVLEVFANGGLSLTARLYPTRPDATGLELFSNGPARVEELDVWEMKGIG